MTVPDWLLERYALGEVTDGERALAEADPDLPAQLAALRDSDRQIKRAHPPAEVGRRVRARRPARAGPLGGGSRWRPLPAAAATVALAAAALALWGRGGPPGDGHQARGLAGSLEVYRQTPGGAERLASGATARAGDVLQLAVVRGDEPYGWIVSVDGAGVVSVHNEGELLPGRTLLPEAYRLDNAPRFERFLLVTDDAPIPREAVVEAARAAREPDAPLDLPGVRTVDVLVLKP